MICEKLHYYRNNFSFFNCFLASSTKLQAHRHQPPPILRHRTGISAAGSCEGKRDLKDQDIHRVMKILEQESKGFTVPIVTEISSRRRDPFHVLV